MNATLATADTSAWLSEALLALESAVRGGAGAVVRAMSVSPNSSPARTDTELASLVERAIARDPEAIAQLYREHQHVLRNFAQRLVGNREAAEDLVQEVFVRLPELLRRYRGDASLSTFLMGVAANRCKNHVRSAARRRDAMARAALEPETRHETPDEALLRRRRAEVLSRALDRLPLKLRLAFVLVAVEQRSADDAAQILDIPPATVRTRVFHARRQLAEWLEKEVRP
ncbi:MAG: sigma-70 family RNA polymerase sigma factor [Sandaracinus sp.]|nr:sigma-70 family RNA polymerase sigma factor [Myxococcales bacterium]MCB9613320.1 sigma-70 family RNA polymerase sigma factor [Sandaracinus sp.]MCB9632193.1 sigma-70 family RNA polymerase sigma factor [Sandaracinus sp.]